MNMESIYLLKRIINKGGIIASCAKYYTEDEQKARQYIQECSEYCQNKVAKDLWGEELALEIVKFQNGNK